MSKIGWKRDGVAPAKLRWTEAVLVCGKCLRRTKDGKALKRALRDELDRRAGGGRAKVVRTACLGLCPKSGIVVASGAGLASGRAVVLVRPDGAEAAMTLLERQGGPRPAKDIS